MGDVMRQLMMMKIKIKLVMKAVLLAFLIVLPLLVYHALQKKNIIKDFVLLLYVVLVCIHLNLAVKIAIQAVHLVSDQILKPVLNVILILSYTTICA